MGGSPDTRTPPNKKKGDVFVRLVVLAKGALDSAGELLAAEMDMLSHSISLERTWYTVFLGAY